MWKSTSKVIGGAWPCVSKVEKSSTGSTVVLDECRKTATVKAGFLVFLLFWVFSHCYHVWFNIIIVGGSAPCDISISTFVRGGTTATSTLHLPTATRLRCRQPGPFAFPRPGHQANPACQTRRRPDRELTAMLNEIDPVRIQAIIEKLVSFGTRHTQSSQTDPERGIGAARDWLLSQYREFAEPVMAR